MSNKKRVKIVAISLLTSLALAGCGDTNSSNSLVDNNRNDTNNSNSLVDDNRSNTIQKTSSLHILPVMSDEDGNLNDAKATYTLVANKEIFIFIKFSHLFYLLNHCSVLVYMFDGHLVYRLLSYLLHL